MTLLITYIALALIVSFLCSIMEAVLLSITPSYVAVKEQQGHRHGALIRSLRTNVDRPLAAILSLNTIAHTVGAAGAGAQAALVFGDSIIALFSAALTLAILVLSEIIPKTLGAVYWRTLAPLVARMLVPTIWLMWPLVKLSQGLTRMLARGKPDTSVSREEISAMADIGHREGVFQAEESRILKSLFRFGSLRARDVMTPRIVMFAFPATMTVGEVLREHGVIRFSRIPIYGRNRDEILGYVLKDDLLYKGAHDEVNLPVSEIVRDMVVVPNGTPLPELFERLLESGEHIALVVDEYGGVEGLVSMEDVVETLLGLEIVDEADNVEDMQALARRQWYRRARKLGLLAEDVDIDSSETDEERLNSQETANTNRSE
jgi:CBS domain containing-hemolysin-like protein